MSTPLTRDTIDAVIEAMAKIVEGRAAEIQVDILNTTSDFEADDLAMLRDEELARADYLRSFKPLITPA